MWATETSGNTTTSNMGFAAYASAISLPAESLDTSAFAVNLDDQFLQLLMQQSATMASNYRPHSPPPALVPAVSKGAPAISSTAAVLDRASESARARRSSSLVKPQFSYRSLVSQALQAAGRNGFTLREVYEWIEAHCPYYAMLTTQGNGASWRSSIRHNLVSHTEFSRATTEGSGSGGDESPDMCHKGTSSSGKSFRACRWALSKDFRTPHGSRQAHHRHSRSTGSPTTIISAPITSPPPFRAPSTILPPTAEFGSVASLCDGMQTNSLSTAASSRPLDTSNTMRRSASVPLVHAAAAAALWPETSWPSREQLHTLPEGVAFDTMDDIASPPLPTLRGSASLHSSPVMTMHTQQPSSSTLEHVHTSPWLYPNPSNTGIDESFIKAEPYEHSPRRATALPCPFAGQYSPEIHDLALWLMDQ